MASFRELFIPTWTEDVGRLHAEAANVTAFCGSCRQDNPADLSALINEFGPRYSLWNRLTPCPNCGRENAYIARRPGGSWQKIMTDAPSGLVAPLHARWSATLPPDVRDTLPIRPMALAIGGCVVVACGPCDFRYFLSSAMAEAWHGGITLQDLVQILARNCGKRDCGICADLIARADVPPGEWPD